MGTAGGALIFGACGSTADGFATGGTYNSATDTIDFAVRSPGTNFSVDVSGLGGGGGGTTLTANATSGLFISGSAITFTPSRLGRLASGEVPGRSDDLVLKNESESNAAELVSIQDFITAIAGNNLTIDSNNRQINAPAPGSTTLLGLTDVPAIGSSGDSLLVNTNQNGFVWGDARDGRVSAMGFVSGGSNTVDPDGPGGNPPRATTVDEHILTIVTTNPAGVQGIFQGAVSQRAPYRGIASTGTVTYVSGDIVRQSAGSDRFWLLTGRRRRTSPPIRSSRRAPDGSASRVARCRRAPGAESRH